MAITNLSQLAQPGIPVGISGIGIASTSARINDLVSVNDDISEFCEMVLSALGHDIKYVDFCKMSKMERKSLLRDIKIKRVLD